MKNINNFKNLLFWYLSGVKFKFYALFKLWLIKQKSENWILSRTSCYGNKIISILDPDIRVYNIQKGRVDYLVEESYNNNIFWDLSFSFFFYFKRKYVFSLITIQNITNWKKLRSPKYVIIDSYSELSDFLFIHKKKPGFKFLANYFDLHHDHSFKSQFDNLGLVNDLETGQLYKSFFLFILNKYGKVPIIFLHMPYQLENRREFLRRSNSIKAGINTIKSEFDNLYIFEVDDNLVNFLPQNSSLPLDPYHFHDDVYMNVSAKIKLSEII